jgi:GTP cyclohydrolase I
MKSLASVLMAAALFAGCQNDSSSNAALEARVKKLEETNAKYAEAFDYLQKAYDNYKKQMQQQQQAQEESEPPDDAVFAVDISSDIANHQVEGPNSATVTVVEAWDFA